MSLKKVIFTIFALLAFLPISAQKLKLFSDDLRLNASYPQQIIMDFLERYFTELPQQSNTTIMTKMADDKVYFRKGNLEKLYQVSDTMFFAISQIDNYYEVKWLIHDMPFITIVFPAQYDLLLGQEKDVAQKELEKCIRLAPQRKIENIIPKNCEALNDSVWISKTDYFEIEDQNNATYYRKTYNGYVPIFDNNNIALSVANLFHGLIPDQDYRMYIEQSLYGMKTIKYTLSLQQWLNYCNHLGLKIYFAIERQQEDGMIASVIAKSPELGFNHLLSILIPRVFIQKQDAVFKVKLTPYIPIHNIKNLYQQKLR